MVAVPRPVRPAAVRPVMAWARRDGKGWSILFVKLYCRVGHWHSNRGPCGVIATACASANATTDLDFLFVAAAATITFCIRTPGFLS